MLDMIPRIDDSIAASSSNSQRRKTPDAPKSKFPAFLLPTRIEPPKFSVLLGASDS